MKAAVLVFLTAAILATALLLGLLRLGSTTLPPPAIALHVSGHPSRLSRERERNSAGLARLEVPQSVEQTTLSRYRTPAPGRDRH
jgi:hypothetical protein